MEIEIKKKNGEVVRLDVLDSFPVNTSWLRSLMQLVQNDLTPLQITDHLQ